MKKNVTITRNSKNKKWLMDMELQIVEQTGKNIPIVPQEKDEPAPEEGGMETGVQAAGE